jgi:cytochrome c
MGTYVAKMLRCFAWLVAVFLGWALPISGQGTFSILVFSKTSGFRHDSIPAGIAAIQAMAKEHGFLVDATEDSGLFTSDNLRKYRVIVFLSTTGNVLNADEKSAFESYIRSGGGFVGIHSATDTEYDWPWYGQLPGGKVVGPH